MSKKRKPVGFKKVVIKRKKKAVAVVPPVEEQTILVVGTPGISDSFTVDNIKIASMEWKGPCIVKDGYEFVLRKGQNTMIVQGVLRKIN